MKACGGWLHLFSAKRRPIKNSFYKSVLFLTLILLPALLWAQVKFYVSVSEGPLVAGQPFQVQYITEGTSDIQDFQLPEFKGFSVYDVFESKSTSVQSPALRVVETFSKIVVLSVKNAGRFTIPAASAIINGKKMKTRTVKIRVLDAGSVTPSLNSIESAEEIPVDELSELKPGDDVDKKVKQNLFVKGYSTKASCYVGEELVLTHKLYSRLNANSQVQKRPSLTGFSVVEMVDAYDGRPETEKINGLLYYANLVRKVHAFPLQAGLIKIDPAEISSVVHFYKLNTGSDPGAGGLNRYTAEDHKVVCSSNPLEIEVKPLPAGQPENFTGAVGKFRVAMEVLQKEIHAGDLVKIRLTISGAGNIPLLVPPAVNWPKGVDTADPVVKEEYNKYVYPLEGSKYFEYSFEAPDTGDYTIPSAVFNYFNPLSRSYETAKTDSLLLRVQAAVSNVNAVVSPGNSPNLPGRSSKKLSWLAVVAGLVVAWVLFQFWQGRKEKQKEQQPVKQAPSAPVIPEDPLEAARTELYQGNTLAFYRETEKAIWKALAIRYEVLPSQLNKQNISAVLRDKGAEPDSTEELISVLKECEWALYAPAHEIRNAESLLERAGLVLKTIG